MKSPKYLFFRRFTLKSLALFMAVTMVSSSTKIPVAYAYFTAGPKESEPISLQIDATLRVTASVDFLDKFLIDDGNANKGIAGAGLRSFGMQAFSLSGDDESLQPLAPKETISALISLEDGLSAEEINIPSVELRYEDRSTPALSGKVRGGDLLVEFDRAEVISWFEDLPETPDEVTLEVTGEGYTEGLKRFVFTGSATIRLAGSYETVAVGIRGPNGYLIPEDGETATGTYHLVNQNGTVLDASWALGEPFAGVAIDPATGRMTVSGEAAVGSVTVVAEFIREDGAHSVGKTVHICPDPHMTISGPRTIVIGSGPQQYTIETRDNVALDNITWQIAGTVNGVTVDNNGLVNVSDGASGGEFVLVVQAELKGIPLAAEIAVTLEEPAGSDVPASAPLDAGLPETALIIEGEDLILIPSEGETAEVSYTAVDRDGNPVSDVTWSMSGAPEGVEFDAARGTITVTSEASEGMLTLEATAERVVESDAAGGTEAATITLSGKKTITVARSAPVSAIVRGPESIAIPAADPENDATVEESFTYEALVVDQKGNVLYGEEVIWSLAEEVPGVAISNEGVLSVTSEAVPGTITIIVTSAATGEIIGMLEIELTGGVSETPGAGGGGVVSDPPMREEDGEDEGIGGGDDDPGGDDEDPGDGSGGEPGGDDPGDSGEPGEGGDPQEPEEPAGPGDEPGQEPGDEPGQEPGDEPGQEPGDEPGQEPGDEPGQEPGDESGQEPGDESGQEPGDEPGPAPGGSEDPGTGQGGGTGGSGDGDGAAGGQDGRPAENDNPADGGGEGSNDGGDGAGQQ